METRLDKEGFEKLYGELPFPNRIIVKQPDLGGGLVLIWKNDVWLELINFTTNHIMVRVLEDDRFIWWLTCIYGWPKAIQSTSHGNCCPILNLLWKVHGFVLEILMQYFSPLRSLVNNRL